MLPNLLTETAERRKRLGELLTMLTYKRPDGSITEEDFVARFLAPLGVLPDEFGNQWLTVGEGSPILWSSHTDTVHKTAGTQRVVYGAGVITSDSGECLGADCTVGVWLMVNMIRAGIPGTYVFHAAEEVGGLGSRYIAVEAKHRLEGIQFAIAFDRKGNDEIITHQAGERTASDAFAASLAVVLRPLMFSPSDGGTFTDTANYSDLIPECTNISVGYYRQHFKDEMQDARHALDLLDALLAADWGGLVCARDPSVKEYAGWGSDWERWLDTRYGPPSGGRKDLRDYVFSNPDSTADFLEAVGYTAEDIEDFERERLGIGRTKN